MSLIFIIIIASTEWQRPYAQHFIKFITFNIEGNPLKELLLLLHFTYKEAQKGEVVCPMSHS